MQNAKKRIIVFAIMFLFLSGCSLQKVENEESILQIRQLAYDYDESGDHIIFIKENSEMIPCG